jgi:hypothetical protein
MLPSLNGDLAPETCNITVRGRLRAVQRPGKDSSRLVQLQLQYYTTQSDSACKLENDQICLLVCTAFRILTTLSFGRHGR